MKPKPTDEQYVGGARVIVTEMIRSSRLIYGKPIDVQVSQWTSSERVESGAYVELKVFVPKALAEEQPE